MTRHQVVAGHLEISVTIAEDGAALVYIDTEGFEPGPTTLRVNVNDGPVFGYPEVAAAPKIQILEVIDSDGNPWVDVYCDGKRHPDADTETVDPGRGYDWGSWWERITNAHAAVKANAPSEYDHACLEALTEAANSQYVTDKPDDWPEQIENLK